MEKKLTKERKTKQRVKGRQTITIVDPSQQIVRNLITSPLGESPERDNRIKAMWRESLG